MDRIRITHPVARLLRDYHLASGKNKEALSYAFANALETAEGDLLMVMADPDSVFLPGPDCYRDQNQGLLMVHADVRAGVIWRGIKEQRKALAIVETHDHWFSRDAVFSGIDNKDDLRAAYLMQNEFSGKLPEGHKIHFISLLMAQDGWRARRVVWEKKDGRLRPAFKQVMVDILGGNGFERHGLPETGEDALWQQRQSTVIAPRQRVILGSLRVALVGAGGTGSIALETLARLGIRHIDLIDGDPIEATNLNRLQGAGFADIGKNKAECLAARTNALFAGATTVRAIPTLAFSDAAISAMQSADLIVGCTDNSESRWFVNRVSIQYAVPWFDCGTALTARAGRPVFETSNHTVIPGLTACGQCSPVTFYARRHPPVFLSLEMLSQQRAAGYIKNEPEAATPSVYCLNQQSVSSMVQEIMTWLFGWGPVALSVYQNSDNSHVERLDLANPHYPTAPDAACTTCGTRLGRCMEDELPREGSHLDFSQHCGGSPEATAAA
ncbi:hypothetical protein AGMMS50256_17420 [Betaproteobacteria bacterium]|nr:hypothetical protein AGMMS50256_17420 [Betaproteobacteria bacterium]